VNERTSAHEQARGAWEEEDDREVESAPVWPTSKSQPGAGQDTAPEEATLVSAAQADPSAFDLLYRRYLEPVYRYVRIQVPYAEDAADLTQQIFLQALDALPTYQARGLPFAAWLFRIARNTVIDSYRRRKGGSVSLELLPEDLHPTTGNDPLTLVLEQEREQKLRRLVDALPTYKRELLILRFAGQLSSSEIALVVGRSPAAVQKQLTRILLELKGRYHDAR
jgi:RNA polymerase sigma-70 factor, ECF subfamily